MVTLQVLKEWKPALLTGVADDLAFVRNALIRSNDDLEDGAPPASWTMAEAEPARAEHADIVEAVAVQVSEIARVVTALDAAATALTRARNELDGALERARSHDVDVDLVTGQVSSSRTFTSDEQAERDRLQLVINEVAAQLSSAVTAADAADADLAAVLVSVATTDAPSALTLDQLDAFLGLSPQERVQYLLDHPELAGDLLPYASDWVKREVGEAIAAEIDAVGRDETVLNDPATVERLTALLDGFGGDSTVMAATYESLGPGGLVAALDSVSSMLYITGSEDLATLAFGLRDGLGVASTDPAFDGEQYGKDLVRYMTPSGMTRLGEDELAAFEAAYPYYSGTGAAILDFLMRDGSYSDDLVRGVAWELDAFERSIGNDVLNWYYHSGAGSPLTSLGMDPGEMRNADPMAAVMGQLGDHPQVALDFFSEGSEDPVCYAPGYELGEAREAYYFGERDWRNDGYEGIARAVHGIGTDPTLLATDPERAGMVLSTFFDLAPENRYFTQEHTAAASPWVGDLLKHYVPSIESSIGTGGDYPPGIQNMDTNPYLGPMYAQPTMDQVDAERLLAVAFGTEEGTARVAEGFGAYRQAVLHGYAESIGGGPVTQGSTALDNILYDSAKLDGFVQKVIGDVGIAEGKSVDEQIAIFTDLTSDAIGLIPIPGADAVGDTLGQIGKNAYTHFINEGITLTENAVSGAFSGNEAAARAAAEQGASLGQEKAFIATYLSMLQAGLVELPPQMADTWVVPGGAAGETRYISLSEIGDAQLQQFRQEANGASTDIYSEDALRSGYRVTYEDYWGTP